jgi:hypothetical protein
MADPEIEIIGGAFFPTRRNRRWWTPRISWPLARLTCDQYGIEVHARSAFLSGFAEGWRRGSTFRPLVSGWQAPWEALEAVATRQGRVLFIMKDPELPCCRFYAMRSSEELRDLVERAVSSGVPVRRVSAIRGWYFGRW